MGTILEEDHGASKPLISCFMSLFCLISPIETHLMKNHTKHLLFLLIIVSSGCKVYKRDLMFQYDDNFTREDLEESVYRASSNYVIEPGDMLTMDLFSNEGERLIDPNPELSGLSTGGSGQSNQIQYLVLQNGTVKLPIIGAISVVGLTIDEAEELLEEAYNEFYAGSFVKLAPGNRRVIVLGSFGGGRGNVGGGQGGGQGLVSGVNSATTGQVIPLENENMTIAEVVALAGGIRQGSNSSTIKLIRGELNEPKIFEIDLSTITGMQKTAMIVENGDVIYLEPWRRPFRQSLAELAPWMSLTSSVIAFTLLIQQSGK